MRKALHDVEWWTGDMQRAPMRQFPTPDRVQACVLLVTCQTHRSDDLLS